MALREREWKRHPGCASRGSFSSNPVWTQLATAASNRHPRLVCTFLGVPPGPAEQHTHISFLRRPGLLATEISHPPTPPAQWTPGALAELQSPQALGRVRCLLGVVVLDEGYPCHLRARWTPHPSMRARVREEEVEESPGGCEWGGGSRLPFPHPSLLAGPGWGEGPGRGGGGGGSLR